MRPIDVFEAELADLKEGGVTRLADAVANAPLDGCVPTRPKFKIATVRTGDRAFDQALSEARKQTIAELMKRIRYSTERYSVDVATEAMPDGQVIVEYERVPDSNPPLVSIAPAAKKVRSREQVSLTIQARDDAAPSDRGIQRIELLDLTDGRTRVGGEYGEYGPVANPCDGDTLRRTVTVTYRVPANPPLLIRLEALAHDKVNRVTGAIASLSTGDYAGEFRWTHRSENLQGAMTGHIEETRGVAQFALKADEEANLTGEIAGVIEVDLEWPTHPTKMVSPGKFTAQLFGGVTPSAMTVEVPDTMSFDQKVMVKDDQGAEWEYAWTAAKYFQDLPRAFRALRSQPDGSRRAEGRVPAQSGGRTNEERSYSLTVWRLPN